MVAASLAIALVGLGAVSLGSPTRTVEQRQILGPPGGGGISTGPSVTTTCLASVPSGEQAPCIPAIVVGGLVPPPHKAKRFTLPPDWNSNINKAIDELELELEGLQNKQTKTQADVDEIKDIHDALSYLTGVVSISAPAGVGTTFHPGKRAAVCPGVVGVELALEKLMQLSNKTPQEEQIQDFLTSFLLGCGITIVQSPDGTTTTLTPSNKRAAATFDLAGVQQAYDIIAQSAGSAETSFNTWLVLQRLASVLRLYGAEVSTTLTPATRRQVFTIGNDTCALADMLNFKQALAVLLKAYGSPQNAPRDIQLLEQLIVYTLSICGETVSGWTGGIIPDPTVPGGAITPNPTVPGGAIQPDPTIPASTIQPDPTIPGGAITPSNKRQVIVSDPSALLAALEALEKQYGNYGSGTIPVPIFLIMENIVTILQSSPGVVVPGWPILVPSTGQLTPGK